MKYAFMRGKDRSMLFGEFHEWLVIKYGQLNNTFSNNSVCHVFYDSKVIKSSNEEESLENIRLHKVPLPRRSFNITEYDSLEDLLANHLLDMI